jgi:hypothetical protein
MTLDEFIANPRWPNSLYVIEPGLTYYVRTDIRRRGMIQLANCRSINDGTKFGFWRFMKKYADRVPFFAEQVINPDMANYFRRSGWREVRDLAEIPSFYSPLTDKLFPPEDYPDWRRSA